MNYYYVPTIRLWQEHKDKQSFKDLHRQINALRSIANAGAIRIPNTPVYAGFGQADAPYQDNVTLQARIDEYFSTLKPLFISLADEVELSVAALVNQYTIECAVSQFTKPAAHELNGLVRAVLVKHKSGLSRLDNDLRDGKQATQSQQDMMQRIQALFACLPNEHAVITIIKSPLAPGLIGKTLNWAGV